MKSGNLNFLEPLEEFQACNGTAYLYLYLSSVNLMEAVPLCDKIEVYIYIFIYLFSLYTTVFHNCE